VEPVPAPQPCWLPIPVELPPSLLVEMLGHLQALILLLVLVERQEP